MPPRTRARSRENVLVLPPNWIPSSLRLIQKSRLNSRARKRLAELYVKPPGIIQENIWPCAQIFTPASLVDSTNRLLGLLWLGEETFENVWQICAGLVDILWADYYVHGRKLLSVVGELPHEARRYDAAAQALSRCYEILRELVGTLKEARLGEVAPSRKHLAAYVVALWNQALVNLLPMYPVLILNHSQAPPRRHTEIDLLFQMVNESEHSLVLDVDREIFRPF